MFDETEEIFNKMCFLHNDEKINFPFRELFSRIKQVNCSVFEEEKVNKSKPRGRTNREKSTLRESEKMDRK